jgi:hypothetical protein
MMRRLPLHPLLFAVYPVVFLYARNVQGEESPVDLVAPLILSIAGMLLVGLVSWLVFRDIHRAGLASSLVVVLVFSFGHVEGAIDPLGVGFAETLLLVAWGLLLVAGLLALAKPRTGLRRATRPLDLVAAVLVALNVVPIVLFEIHTTAERLTEASEAVVPAGSVDSTKRDIYYLIFDRYAADRTLRDVYGFDNSDFSGWLAQQGFYVAYDSLANYPKTTHSLASSLNMNYLADLAARVGRDSGDWAPLTDGLSGFRAATSLQGLGYRYYHVGSWWSGTGLDPTADEDLVFDTPLEFDDVLLDSTIIPALVRRVGIGEGASFELTQYRRVRFQFDALERISRDPSPTFAFVHLTMPHPPYVFDADGSFVPPQEEVQRSRKDAYLAQLAFTNHEIERVVGDLLAGPSESDPIVVLQSDEGPHPVRLVQEENAFVWTEATDAELGEKLRILNAYFLPGLDDPGLYPTISPVNTFRLILSKYFDADLPLLQDRTFVFERNAYPYRFTDVTARLRP